MDALQALEQGPRQGAPCESGRLARGVDHRKVDRAPGDVLPDFAQMGFSRRASADRDDVEVVGAQFGCRVSDRTSVPGIIEHGCPKREEQSRRGEQPEQGVVGPQPHQHGCAVRTDRKGIDERDKPWIGFERGSRITHGRNYSASPGMTAAPLEASSSMGSADPEGASGAESRTFAASASVGVQTSSSASGSLSSRTARSSSWYST